MENERTIDRIKRIADPDTMQAGNMTPEITRLCFSIKGVRVESLYDIDNIGIFALQIPEGLAGLEKLLEVNNETK